MKFLIRIMIFFNIIPTAGNLLSRQIKKIKSTNPEIFFFFFFANQVIYFLNKLPNEIKK